MTKLNIIMYGRTLYVYTLNKLLLLLFAFKVMIIVIFMHVR